jgi:hypothetical protein
VLLKPFLPEDLERAVKLACERRAGR